MNLNIHIDLDNTYRLQAVSQDLLMFHFTSFDVEDCPVEIHVHITENYSQFLPGVLNIAFGPLNSLGEIDDMAVIKHKDSSKVFSTILLGGITFLRSNPDRFLGLDGSNLIRACLYYKLLQINYDYLSQHVNSFGIKYYIRLLRGKEKDDPLMPDEDDIATHPFKIPKYFSIKWEKMFNYFMFSL